MLDGKTLSLKEGTLVIADHAKIQALAGVMGGEDSMVSETTKNVFVIIASG